MRKAQILFLFIGLIWTVACAPTELEQKKAQLKKYKSQALELNGQIAQLEKEIATLDPSFAKANREATLVTTTSVEKRKFEHFVEVNGSIESRRNATLSAETGGRIIRNYVREGDWVKKGALLFSLDDDVQNNSIKELETQLELARTVYEKRANLWEQNIGSEIQYLEAKNNVEALERSLETAKSQLGKAHIAAPFTGTVDKIFLKEGEMAQPGVPAIRLVSMEDMYVEVELSEAFIGRIKKGEPAQIIFPNIDSVFMSTVSAVSNVVNRDNRTFTIDIKVPRVDFIIKPNQIALVKIKDFEKENAVVVPTNLIQMDSKGDYVYVIDTKDSVQVARKASVERGVTYNNKTMITAGLQGGEELIADGFREVGDGRQVRKVEPAI